ncbi:TPA: N-acylneuraminate cytidylyltransferase [Enterococcus faecium]|nr:N-acylneuraminate cytidylyltransferase [Enterococcus faecium]
MNVAFIPVRGGSKSIPLKNIKPISGRPLIYWTVKAACECEYIDKVYVATDSDSIKNAVESFSPENDVFEKIVIVGRSAESASDTASTEFAMLEFAEGLQFDNIVLVQATSPLLTGKDLNNGFIAFSQDNVDSVLSVVRQKRFHWAEKEDGIAYPTNYDVFNRPRRQDFDGYLVENGAFYITSRKALLESRNRVSGNIKAVEMNEDTFFEIDEPSDWVIIEALMKKNGIEAEKKIPEIKMFLTDCDGCLTDAGMYYSEHGDELKKFNTRDGMAFAMLRAKGIITGIVTSERVDLNRRRAEKLKLDILEAGCKDKFTTIKKLCDQYGISLEQVAYVGDDINDLEVIQNIGFGCCPNDAVPSVKKAAEYISAKNGGEGVIRDLVDHIYENK